MLIDYAHTSDALENVLSTLKDLALNRGGRLLLLFGCSGNRDSIKRPKMGKTASEIADFVVITDDNPRKENGQEIMTEIARGEDVVILAGKGHETYQVQQSGSIHFDDREEAGNALDKRLAHKA